VIAVAEFYEWRRTSSGTSGRALEGVGRGGRDDPGAWEAFSYAIVAGAAARSRRSAARWTRAYPSCASCRRATTTQAARPGAAARRRGAIRPHPARLGADLHDGPAQHLAFAALRLDALRGRLEGTPTRRT
jgi:signal transduction histidine kinase